MIYLDYAATTACSEEVVAAMLPYFRESFANASSTDHALGSKAKEAVERAREQVAEFVGAQPEDVVFTSGSTEANNLALSVTLPVTTTPIEHPSVLDTFKARGKDVDTLVEISSEGLVDFDSLVRQIEHRRCLISVIATNNETGVEQDLETIARLAADAGSLLHLDATQTVGTRVLEMKRHSISAVSLSAHKIYGPKGVGALIVSGPMRRELRPILHGGGHERGLRSGTLNVAGIVGFGVAAGSARKNLAARRDHLATLRCAFIDALSAIVGGDVVETIRTGPVSPHILSLRIAGTNGRALLRAVKDEVAFSLGSACATNKAEPSHVLMAMGLEKKAISETIRCSFSAEQSVEEVETAGRAIGEAARSLASYTLPS